MNADENIGRQAENLMSAFLEDTGFDCLIIDVLLLICRSVLQCPVPARAEIATLFKNFTSSAADRLVGLIERNQVKASFGTEGYVATCLEGLSSLNDDSPGFADRSIIAAVQEIQQRIGDEHSAVHSIY